MTQIDAKIVDPANSGEQKQKILTFTTYAIVYICNVIFYYAYLYDEYHRIKRWSIYKKLTNYCLRHSDF